MTCRGIPGITCYPCEGGTKRLPLFFSIISHRATIVTQFQNPGAPTIPVNGIRASFFSCKTVPRRTELYSLSIRRGISIMRSCSSYCGSCGLAIRQPVSKPLLDGAVRAFRVVCCVYTIADLRSAGTSFSQNAVLRERNAESPYSKVKIGSSRVRRSSFYRNSGRLLRNRHEKVIKKGFPDRKPFHFAIFRPVRM